jgi:ABC-2 type transport system permease protein
MALPERSSSVFTAIVRHELRQVRRDGRFAAMALAMGILLILALVTGWRDMADHRRTVQRAEIEQRQRWIGMIAMPPHLAAHAGMMVFRQWPSLSALDPGVNAETGTAIFLEAHKRNFFDHRPAEDEQVPSIFPRMSVAAILQGLVPLAILFAAPMLIAFEREQGVWRLALAAGVEARTLAIGKAIGVALPVALLLVPVAGVAAWLGTAGASDLVHGLVRTIVLATIHFIYYVTLLCLTVAVSALARSSRQAFGAASVLWLLFVLVVPRVSQEVAQVWAPSPTVRQFTDEILEAQTRRPDFFEHRAEVLKRLKEQFAVTREIDLPVSPYGLTLYEGEEEETALFASMFTRLFSTYDTQQRIVRAASVLSPAIAIEAVSSAMAGTDWAHQQDFADQAEAYRRVLVQSLNKALTDGGAAAQYGEVDSDVYKAIPPFQYRLPGPAFAVVACAGSMGVLMVWLAASASVAVLALRRREVP